MADKLARLFSMVGSCGHAINRHQLVVLEAEYCPQCGQNVTVLYASDKIINKPLLKVPRSPSGLDRIEASHWVRQAREELQGWLGCSERFDQFPAGIGSYEHWTADLDSAIATIELAKKALRGQHTRGGTSILQGMAGGGKTRQPDTRPTAERRPERSA